MLLLEPADLHEARWIAQLVEADLDLIIWDERAFSDEARNYAPNRMLLDRPDLAFLDISSASGAKREVAVELEQRIKTLLNEKIEGGNVL